jgi:hypothetical protein
VNQYLLSVYQPEGREQPSPDVLRAIMKDVYAVRQEMKTAGVWVFSGGLHPPGTATVVRAEHGRMLTTDGPFAETKEHIGGFSIIKAADLDAALKWASKLAAATTLPIEVRPFREENTPDA